MGEVQASDAKTHLPSLLDEVEHGETLVITRHGKPIARLVPETQSRTTEIAAEIASMLAAGQRNGKRPVEEILSARREGHN